MRAIKSTKALAPYLSLVLLLGGHLLPQREAHANLLLETSAEREGTGTRRSYELGVELGGGVLKVSRGDGDKRDHAWLVNTRLAFLFRYRHLYVTPAVEFQYLYLDVNAEESIDNAKLSSSRTLDGAARGMFTTVAVGGTAGAVIPSSWLHTRRVQLGGFVEGFVMPREGQLRLQELYVLYGAKVRDVLNREELDEVIDGRLPGTSQTGRKHLGDDIERSLRDLAVTYRMWTMTVAGFVTVPFGEYGARPTGEGFWNIVSQPFRLSALSFGVGWVHLSLSVDVEMNATLAMLIRGDPSEEVTKDKPIGLLRYSLPFGRHLGLELSGATGPQNGAWIWKMDGAMSVRF